jgi:nicotinamide mononucleotide transporter
MPNKKEIKMKNPFKDWTLFEKSWLAVFTLVAMGLSYTWGDTLFSFSVFLTGVICVVLVARGSIWNYSYGLYNAGGYAWLSYQNGLYGEVMLNAGYFLPAQIVGIFLWKENLAKGTTVVMRKMEKLTMAGWLVLSGGLTYAYGVILSTIPGQNTPFFDSCSTVLSVIAMILMIYRYREQWILWIIVDIVSVAMWAFRLESGVEGAPAMLVMWSAFLVNAFYGWYKWNKLAVSGVQNA